MEAGELGRTYQDGEIIIGEGEPGDRMYVIQSGKVAVTRRMNDREVYIAELGKEEVFGEMALFDRDVRSATIRAVGPVRVLSVDKRTFLRRVHEDPSLAFRILQQMSRRIRATDGELTELRERVEGAASAFPSRPSSRLGPLPRGAGLLRYFLPWRWGRAAAFSSGTSTARAERAEKRSRDRRRDERRAAERRDEERRSADRRQASRRKDRGAGAD